MTAVVEIAGLTLVHFVWQGAAIAALAAAGLWLLRHAPPQARYLLACLALALMIAAPLMTALMLGTTASSAATSTIDAAMSPGIAVSAGVHVPASQGDGRVTGTGVLPWVVAIWATGATALLLRLGLGWHRIGGLRRAALLASPSRWAPAGAAMADRLGLQRVIRVVDSVAIDTPIVIGWLRPVVLLPVAALANLTPGQVSAILAHELAHVRRHDFAVNVLQALTETALFYHPVVWWLSNRIRVEREHCCDAIAVAMGGDAVAYVEALTEIEAWRTGEARLAVAATGGSLIDRVRRVLGAEAHPPTRSAGVVIAATLALLIAAGGAVLVTAIEPAPASDGNAVAWRIVFDHPTGELSVKGFTGRDLIRFAYDDIRLTMSPLLATAGRFRIPGVRLPGMSRLPGELAQQLGVTIRPIMHPYDVIVVGNISKPAE